MTSRLAHRHHHHHDVVDHNLGPSGEGTVVLDIGGDTGALVVYTGPECFGQEIEISSLDRPAEPRTHAAVRERHLADGVLYSVVYDNLAEGRYVLWRDPTTPAGSVTIAGGMVTEYQWPRGG